MINEYDEYQMGNYVYDKNNNLITINRDNYFLPYKKIIANHYTLQCTNCAINRVYERYYYDDDELRSSCDFYTFKFNCMEVKVQINLNESGDYVGISINSNNCFEKKVFQSNILYIHWLQNIIKRYTGESIIFDQNHKIIFGLNKRHINFLNNKP